jgi:membrane AbrB-like protein
MLNGLTILIASIGGFLFSYTGLPLSWLMGSIIFVTITSQFVKLEISTTIRNSATAILGVIVGSLVTMSFFTLLTDHIITISAVLLFQLILAACGMKILMYFARKDAVTSFLASYPGSISQITSISLDEKCDAAIVALNHTCRVLVVILAIPVILVGIDNLTLTPTDIVITKEPLQNYNFPLVLAILGAVIGNMLRLSTPALFGPMLLTAALSVAGYLPEFEIGNWLLPIAQIIIGAAIGIRCVNLSRSDYKRIISVHLPYAVFLLSITLTASFALHYFLQIPFRLSLLLMTPGGLSEIILISIALNIDPLVVTIHHLARSLFGLLVIPIFLFSLKRYHFKTT